jgi:hypothetical protein
MAAIFAVTGRTVLICTTDHSPFIFMYQPVLQTLRSGLEGLGAKVHILFGHRNVWPKSSRLVGGDLLVWVGIPGRDFGLVKWAKLRGRGVRSAWYNSEPMLDDRILVPKCRRSYTNAFASVDEIWDYSLFNLHTCAAAAENISRVLNRSLVLRYVPPGALNLNLSSAETPPPDGRAVFLGLIPANVSGGRHWQVGFLRRGECFAELERKVGHSHLYHTAAVWSTEALRRLLTQHSTFLNIHKWCGTPQHVDSPAEALRFAPLLSVGAVVLSEHVYPPDEEQYQGLVRFVNWEGFAPALRRIQGVATEASDPRSLQAPPKPVSGIAEGEAARHARSVEFQRRFAPVALLRAAGIHSSSPPAGTAIEEQRMIEEQGIRNRRTGVWLMQPHATSGSSRRLSARRPCWL